MGLTLALNAMHFDGGQPNCAAAGGVFDDGAHFEGLLAPAAPLGEPFNLTLYEQRVSAILPPGGPTQGGTVVRVEGVGLRGFAPHDAACRFGELPADADLAGADGSSLV